MWHVTHSLDWWTCSRRIGIWQTLIGGPWSISREIFRKPRTEKYRWLIRMGDYICDVDTWITIPIPNCTIYGKWRGPGVITPQKNHMVCTVCSCTQLQIILIDVGSFWFSFLVSQNNYNYVCRDSQLCYTWWRRLDGVSRVHKLPLVACCVVTRFGQSRN